MPLAFLLLPRSPEPMLPPTLGAPGWPMNCDGWLPSAVRLSTAQGLSDINYGTMTLPNVRASLSPPLWHRPCKPPF